MSTLVSALWPVAALVALGWVLRRIEFIKEHEWPPIERIVYFVVFPPLLFISLADADLKGQPIAAFATVLFLTQGAMFLLAVAMRRLFKIGGPAYTSLVQGVVRWNTYVVIGMVPLLFDRSALSLAALAVALMVPFANLLSVGVLARHGEGASGGTGSFVRALVRNPLLIACVLGIMWNLTGLELPDFLHEPLSILGRATLSLGLMAVGAALKPITSGGGRVLVLAVVGQLVAKPLIVLALALLFQLGPVATGVAVLSCAVPTASSAYILSRLMKGDADLMAAIITVQTIVAFVTLPLMLALVL